MKSTKQKHDAPTAVVYVRVSTAEQVDNYSLSTQTKACMDYCEKEGFNIVQIFREEGASAKDANRPELMKLINFCMKKSNPIDYLVVYKLDRFSRSVEHHHIIKAMLATHGVKLRAVHDAVDDSPHGKLMENIHATFAQFENDVRSQRVTEAMREALVTGRWQWQAPIGYKRGVSPQEPSLIIDPDNGPIVKMAFDLIASGASTKSEALKEVTGMGLRTRKGKALTPQTFGELLKNPAYKGRVFSKKWGYEGPGDFQAIVDDATFERVQRAKFANTISEDGKRRLDNPDFPLRRFIRCADCDAPLTGSWSTSRSKKKYGYYRCPNQDCLGTNVRKEEMEAAFTAHLASLSVRPEAMRLLKAITEDAWKERTAAQRNAINTAQQQLDELMLKKNRLIDAYLYQQKIDEKTYQQQCQRLDAEIAALEDEVAKPAPDRSRLERAVVYASSLLTDVLGYWNRLENLKKLRFQDAIHPQGMTYAEGVLGTKQISCLFTIFGDPDAGIEGLAVPTGPIRTAKCWSAAQLSN